MVIISYMKELQGAGTGALSTEVQGDNFLDTPLSTEHAYFLNILKLPVSYAMTQELAHNITKTKGHAFGLKIGFLCQLKLRSTFATPC